MPSTWVILILLSGCCLSMEPAAMQPPYGRMLLTLHGWVPMSRLLTCPVTAARSLSLKEAFTMTTGGVFSLISFI